MSSPIIGGSISPRNNFSWLGGGTTHKLWELAVVDSAAGTVKLQYPGTLRKTSDVDDTGVITIADIAATFTVVADDYLALKIESDLTTTLVKNSGDWGNFPFPYETETVSPHKKFDEGYVVLWKIIARPAELNAADEVPINASLAAKRLVPNASLVIKVPFVEEPGGQVISVPEVYIGMTGA